MNTSLEDLNDNQYEALKQLKKNTCDVLPTDYPDAFLLKWLRAYNYNIKKTEFHFRGDLRVRELYEMDSLAEKYVKPEVVSKYEFTSFIGFAKNGTPIRYTRFFSGDYMGFIQSLNCYELALYASYIIESDIAEIKKRSEKDTKPEVTYIIDMTRVSLRDLIQKSAIETAFDLIIMMQDHYPEMWGNILVVNAPGIFDKIFNLFKPILKLSMLQKIRLASRESTPTLLLKYIDENVLPAFLGGKRTDSNGNPRCPEFVNFGSNVPPEYYLRNRIISLKSSDPDVTSLWVSPRCVYNHTVVIRQPHSKIHVQIRSENGSISFKMLFREFGADPNIPDLPSCDEYLDENNPESNVKFISPVMRIQTHITPVDHRVNAPWPGIYIFRFDNSYSWFLSRRIIFRIREATNDD